ncbi:peptidylprolyl isomerase [Flavobacterium sp. CS20]|uniref:peptidylprolyl isomerase n=1 Tax=Flavobacterium sp. CS20 TaxID=2775246 RepID=UPI001B3A644D|nr:peptidylprolyl isomerase [Flavobacterium sp. CS20]QTY26016.1 peptidylprolyl isomerase [Flavobacterium sp. CS20]
MNEFERYRKQLADKYISNGKVTEQLVQETYHRMTNEVNASHILIAIKPNATPEDTLKAYNTAIDILKKIENGQSFEDLALKYSNDPSARVNKGNLGWFKAFKMVYPFENAVYNLKINEVSYPVRTQFGYHLIKKNDERPSRGKLEVAHIMKNLQSQDSSYNAKAEIQKLYQKLQNGEKFEDLAKQFSDHKPTASNGGKLLPFSVGQLNSAKFEDVAFSLNQNNPMSKPFKTQFGWHIVKYIDEIPVKPLEEIKTDIVKKIKTSDRSKKLIENIKKDLMNQYEVSINYELLSTIEDRIDESILKFKWKYKEKETDKNEWILKIDTTEYRLNKFLEYIEKHQRSLTENTINQKINTAIDKFSYAKLIEFHNQNLEEVSPEFLAEIKTYYEGLLLFEVMEQNIWNPTKEDTLAQKEYFKKHRSNFVSPIKINAVLASSSSKKEAKQIKRNMNNDPINVLRQQFPNAIFKTLNETEINDSSLPKNIDLKVNKPKLYQHNNQYVVLYISKIHSSKPLKFKEVRGQIISDLQKEREDEWIAELREKHDIKINQKLIKSIQL